MSERKRTKRERCVACGAAISGEYIGQPFHSQACARVLLQRILLSVPGVIELLPREWRCDLSPPELRVLGEWKPHPHRLTDHAVRADRE